MSLAVLLPGVAAAQTAGTVTLSATANNGDRDPDRPGLQVDEGDTVTLTTTGHELTEVVVTNFVVTGTATSVSDYHRTEDSTGGIDTVFGLPPDSPVSSRDYLIVNDSDAEADEMLIVTIDRLTDGSLAGNPPNRTTIGAPSSLTITIRANDGGGSAPAVTDTIAPQTYTANTAIPPLQLPAASGGDGTLNYALTPDVATAVPGLAFDRDTRRVTGTPTTAATAVTLTYTAADTDANTDDTASLTFSITVQAAPPPPEPPAPPPDTAPAFTATIADQTYTAGETISALELPAATGGDGSLTYALAPLPAGLDFAANSRRLSGAPTTAGATALTYTATDADPNTAPADTAALTFRVVVQPAPVMPPEPPAPPPDTAPAFAAAITAQTYTAGEAIPALQLPAATGGDGTLTYSLTPEVATAVPGLAFDRDTRQVTGTPTTAAASALTYAAADSDGDTAALTFIVTVEAAPPPPPEPPEPPEPPGALNALNEVILPEVGRALADRHNSAIVGRVAEARSSDGGGRANLGGQSTLAAVAAAQFKSLADGGGDMKALFGASEFALPLSGGGDGDGSSVALWGGGEQRRLSGDNGIIDWDGDLFGAHLGVDARLRRGLLGGLLLAWSEGEFDTTDDTPGRRRTGNYDFDMTSLHPYIGGDSADGRFDWWATLGRGSGEVSIRERGAAGRATGDLTLQTFAAGASDQLRIRGGNELRLKGEFQQTRLEVDDADDARFAGLDVDANRLRVALEMTRHGARFQPSLEVGYRYDGGDGDTGSGMEISGALRYAGPRATLSAHTRALLGHSGETEELGIGASVHLSPGADSQGLSLSLTPAYGDTAGKDLWQHRLSDTTTLERNRHARMDIRLGYGLSGIHGGLLTPYTEMTLGEEKQNYRLGLRWELGRLFDMKLVGERLDGGDGVWLEGAVRF